MSSLRPFVLDKKLFNADLYRRIQSLWFVDVPQRATTPPPSASKRWWGIGVSEADKESFDSACRSAFLDAIAAHGLMTDVAAAHPAGLDGAGRGAALVHAVVGAEVALLGRRDDAVAARAHAGALDAREARQRQLVVRFGEVALGLEDVDLVDAAILMQRRANRGIDLGTRQPRKIAPRPCQSGEMGDARRVVAAVRDADEPVLESERAHNLRGARQQRDY